MKTLDDKAVRQLYSRTVARAKYVARLTSNPEFWDDISEPFMDAGKLDTTLATVCYGSLLMSQLIKYKPLIRRLIKVLLRSKSAPITALSSSDAATAQILKSISGYISDVRIFNRMWALPGTIGFLISGLRAVSNQSGPWNTMKVLEAVDIVAIALYQPLENLAFANDHGWTYNDESLASKLTDYYYTTSSKLWGLYLVLEVVKLGKKLIDYRRSGVDPWEDDGLKQELVSDIVNIPLSYHWAQPEGWLGDTAVGFLGLIASLPETRQVWGEVIDKVRQI